MSEVPTTHKVNTRSKELEVLLPDTRGVTLSPWGKGNLKLGPNVVTYSRPPGRPSPHGGSCPGATPECLSWCYAFRIAKEEPLASVYRSNQRYWQEGALALPPLPEGTEIVRLHVSGDFDTIRYIGAWQDLAVEHPDVRFFGYTRSWRVPSLKSYLEYFRALSNVQLFASIDASITREELDGIQDWRWAPVETDSRLVPIREGVWRRHAWESLSKGLLVERKSGITCPEETGRKPNCEACRYCIDGRRGDVIWKRH